jgi:hypothetical protein
MDLEILVHSFEVDTLRLTRHDINLAMPSKLKVSKRETKVPIILLYSNSCYEYGRPSLCCENSPTKSSLFEFDMAELHKFVDSI